MQQTYEEELAELAAEIMGDYPDMPVLAAVRLAEALIEPLYVFTSTPVRCAHYALKRHKEITTMQKQPPTVKHTTQQFEDWTRHLFTCTSAVEASYADDQPDVIEFCISGGCLTVVRASLPALRAVLEALEAAQ